MCKDIVSLCITACKNDNYAFCIDNYPYFCIRVNTRKREKLNQRIIISDNIAADLEAAIAATEHDKTFVLTDETTVRLCYPLIKDSPNISDAPVISIAAGDEHKDMASLMHVWQELSSRGATRHSLIVNLGGGMVTDLGGFAASTFKRGVTFINVPTTLLAMVDASVGGKTGVNFNGLKNEIGVFNDAKYVIVNTQFLKTLDTDNIVSGYAEMLKHGLISDVATWRELVGFDLCHPDLRQLQAMVARSVEVKEHIVNIDPREKGIRKALNFGHTVGHALESLSLRRKRPVLHGCAVAAGMVCELYMSVIKTAFPTDIMQQTVAFIRDNYEHIDFDCNDYDELQELMTHDKKNVSGVINFTLLAGIGDVKINQPASRDDIFAALDFYREG